MLDPAHLPETVDDLRTVLASRRWRRRTSPFPHVVAEDVFVPEVYEQLAHDFRMSLDRHEHANYNRQHDFFGCSLLAASCGTLGLFLSPAWYALFTRLFRVEGPGYLTAGLHRHRPGSRNGFPHNDIYPEQLRPGTAGSDVLGFDGHVPGRAVRAVAVLFYLNNGPWMPGDGGETALFRDWKDSLDESVESVAPRDNTLLAFGCNPHSYHAFRSNRKRRDSVISFVYRGLDDYVELWGDEGVQQYAEYGRHDG